MSGERTLRIFYHRQLLARAGAGGHNYTNRIRAAMDRIGWSLQLRLDTDAARARSANDAGYSLFHMAPPLGPRCLTTRLAYFYPFWRIEASAKRWEFDVARTTFDPSDVDPQAAALFCNRRRTQYLAGIRPEGDAIFIPLQGKIAEHRSFQTMSPLAMVGQTLDRTADRRIIVSLHPNESYSKADLGSLDALAEKYDRLIITRQPMAKVLPNVSLIVTQNSSVALHGFLLGLPAILFAQIDFHHIALNVADLGVDECFSRFRDHSPDYERYCFWFFRKMSINAAAEDAEDQILAAFRRHGWPI